MARGPLTFRQRDLTRAIKAALAVGLVIERAWIEIDGRIILGHFAAPLTRAKHQLIERPPRVTDLIERGP